MADTLYEDQKPRFATIPNNSVATFTNASSIDSPYIYANQQVVWTAGDNGGVLISVGITSDDTVNRNIYLGLRDPANAMFFHILTVVATLGAGTNGTTNTIDGLGITIAAFLESLANAKKGGVFEAGQQLIAGIPVVPSSGKKLQVF